MKILLSMICVLFLSSCANSEVKREKSFDSSSNEGLAIIGVNGTKTVSVTFASFDSSTKKLQANTFSGHAGLTHYGGKTTDYKLIRMAPARYVLKHLQYSMYRQGSRMTVFCLNHETYEFEIKPGQILYFGDVHFDAKDRVTVKKGDLEKASRLLAKYPEVHGEVVAAEVKPSSFVNGTDIFGSSEVCGGYYYD